MYVSRGSIIYVMTALTFVRTYKSIHVVLMFSNANR